MYSPPSNEEYASPADELNDSALDAPTAVTAIEERQPTGPQFPGAGTSGAGAPLQALVGPDSAGECVPGTPTTAGSPGSQSADGATLCFFDEEDPSALAATLEQVLEVVDDVEWIHIRLTLNPNFVDNTFGEGAIGWENSKKGKHSFKDLVGSDHAEIKLTNGDDETVLHFKVDYLSEDPDAPSGYASLGVSGGDRDGEVLVGDEDWVLGHATSLDRNLNGCGLSSYTEDSPITDSLYTPNPDASAWDYRMVYELWIALEPFGDAGFGHAFIEFVHASPSKGEDNTIVVAPGPCPPDWGCESSVASEGRCL